MTTIRDLSFNDTPASSDSVPVYGTNSGMTQRTSINKLLQGGLSSLPTVQPVDGSGELWIDALDGNAVKAAIGPSSISGVNLPQTVVNIANGTAQDAGTLTGAEITPLSRGAGALQTTLTKIAQWVIGTFQGFTQSGTGAVARTVQNRMRDTVSVKDFGAKGDGVTDDSAAVQAAINFLQIGGTYDQNAYGGDLLFPEGAYVVSGLTVSKPGIRFKGVGKDITFLVNASPSAQMIVMTRAAGDPSISLSEIDFENLQFRNTVNRSWGAPFLLQGTNIVRMRFHNVDFVSSAFSSGNRQALQCNFVSLPTFESKFDHCNWWGVIGCAVELPDGPQADTLIFDHCVWMYCSLAGAIGIGSASGINNVQFLSCKVVGNQGGYYTANSNDNFAYTTIAAASAGSNQIQVTSATNFTVGKCVVIGRNVTTLQYAFVQSINGTTITLDRNVTVNLNDDIVHGTFGFIFAHTATTKFQGTQLEGCDVGIYSTTGRQITYESGSIGSCARPFLLNGEFRYLKVGSTIASTIGSMKNSVAWQFVTIISTLDANNIIDLSDCDCEGSGYYDGSTMGSLLINGSGFTIRTIFRSRAYGPQYAGNGGPVVTFLDSASLTFNRSSTGQFCRTRWQTLGADKWFMDFNNSSGDLYFKLNGQTSNSLFLSGSNGIVQLGDGTWNGLPIKLGSYYLWLDTSGLLRTKNGSPTSATDGSPMSLQVAVPASATATGAPGQWATDGTYFYVCSAANTWKRSAVAAW